MEIARREYSAKGTIVSNLSKQIEQAKNILKTELVKLEVALQELPEGSLYCNNKKAQSYYSQCVYANGVRKQNYVGTSTGKNAKLIAALKRKRFLLKCKKVLEKDVEALEVCLQKYEEFDPSKISQNLATTYESIKYPGQSPVDLDWQNAPYQRAEMHPENLKHETAGGLRVRSKSEALIAFALDLAQIPFHYEEILELDDKKIVPDFTIRHPSTKEIYYWEHFGMMDDPAYAGDTYKKMIVYGRNGIFPGQNLIFTMENTENPLSIQEIQRTISHHFST